MKPIEEIYPNCNEYGSFYGPGSYYPLLKSLSEIVLKVDDDDYQGDSRVLYKDGERYGLLIFGWGSCSGCDALQACDSYQEIDDLRNSLNNRIQWFDGKASCLNYFNTHDWKGDYSWHAEETRQFITEATALLSK